MQHIYNDMPKNGRYGRVTIYRDKYRSCLLLKLLLLLQTLGSLSCYSEVIKMNRWENLQIWLKQFDGTS